MSKFDNWFEILPGTKKGPEGSTTKAELFLDDAPPGDNTD
jgi:hypothetical protein